MIERKMAVTLLCVLLIGNYAQAVVNKATSKPADAKEEEKQNEITADDRISNSYGPPSDEYGPSLGPSFGAAAPVYGPPELVGDQGPVAVYPPLPPDVPPPAFGLPALSYGPPRAIKPLHGPPKQSYGPALPPKLNFGPSKHHFGPIKQHLGPLTASFGAFRPKPQYAPPTKFLINNQYGPPKVGHGSPIPISLESYGPPPPKVTVQFSSAQRDEYGPPPPPPHHVAPGNDLYGPPPPAPPPGVPAPPTPPDIKYDGWQPIAGLSSQQGPPSNSYGAPHQEAHGHHSVHLSSNDNPNVPSDSYGVPIHSPEAQDLKSSVHQSSASSENSGLPPPPLPQYEPLHNADQQPPRSEKYTAPSVEPLSIVKTVGFELLPTSAGLAIDLQGVTLSEGAHGGQNHLGAGNSLPSLHLGIEELALGNSHGYQGGGNDLSLQHLPIEGPSSGYGPPGGSFVNPGLAPPPSLDTYSAPPLSSYSPNGPYPAAQSGRASSFSTFGGFGASFHKHGSHHHRAHGGFRAPAPPLNSLVPPRNREPLKFREPIPTGLLSNLHRYLRPLNKPIKSFVPPPSFGQQLPSLGAPLPFHPTSGHSFSSSFSGAFSSGGSFGKPHDLNSPIAAPHVQYGTPLSFVDFNTPAPILTYGAPNFGPASSFVSTSSGFGNNLYEGLSNGLTTTYGTPVVNPQRSNGAGHDCGFYQSSGADVLVSFNQEEKHGHDLQIPGPSFAASLPSGPSSVESLSSGPSSLGVIASGPSSLESLPAPPSYQSLSSDHSAHDSLSHLGLTSHSSSSHSSGLNSPSPHYSGLSSLSSHSSGFSSASSHSSGFSSVSSHSSGLNSPSPHSSESFSSHSSSLDTLPPHSSSLDNHHPAPPSQHSLSVSYNAISSALSSGPPSLSPLDLPPTVSHLDLQNYQQQKTDLKDSYGNPIGIRYEGSEEVDNSLSSSTSVESSQEVPGVLPISPSGRSQSGFSSSHEFHDSRGISAEALTASLTMQGFGQGKSHGSNEVDASQFLKTEEGSEALSLAQGLTAEGADGFQIQGSKGTYTLQIQAADGGLGTENSDGSIRHDQVLSNGLLQDILAAIEQPEHGQVQLQGPPEAQPLQKVFEEVSRSGTLPANARFLTIGDGARKEELEDLVSRVAESNEESADPAKSGAIALFYNHQFGESRKDTRSVSKSEASAENEKNEAKGKSS